MTWAYADRQNTVVTNGKGLFVPCDNANTDWLAIVASGVEIAPVPDAIPAATPKTAPVAPPAS